MKLRFMSSPTIWVLLLAGINTPVSNAQTPDGEPVTVQKERQPGEKPVTVEFEVKDTRGRPVAGATFTLNGKTVGLTQEAGTLRTQYAGREGEVLRFGLVPPAGYRIPPTVDQSRWATTVNHPPSAPLETAFSVTLHLLEDIERWTTDQAEEGFTVTLLGGKIEALPNAKDRHIIRLTLALRNATERARPTKPMPIILWAANGTRLPNVDPAFASMKVAESNGRRAQGDRYAGQLAAGEVLHISLVSHSMKQLRGEKVRFKMEWKSPGENTVVKGEIPLP